MARVFVMGDPQAPFAKIRDVLACHRALDGDRIARDVVLVSIGDHFDYDVKDPALAGQQGLELVRWLADQDPARVVLLLGNHDAARVMELATLDDERFDAARKLARAVDAGERTAEEYAAAFPDLPPHGVIGRDYASFTTAQRGIVVELLLAGRFQLARTAALPDGRTVLLTHAGVTARELDLLGAAADAHAVAAALNRTLAAAIDRVRGSWQRGELAPLSLAPLHVTGGFGEEGGGLLYHRPSNPARAEDKAWSRMRRFDPRKLPVGVTQIAGHTGHAKCVDELGGWVAPAAKTRKHGGIRTLRVDGARVVYDMGIAPAKPGVADLILIDGELRRVPATEFALLPLARLD